MSRQVQVPGVGMIALGVFIVGFVLLMLVGYSFLAALFFALVVTAAVAIFFLVAGDRPQAQGRAGSTAGASGGTPDTRAAPAASSTPPASEPPRAPAPSPTPGGDQTEPERLDAPREGGADDLKRIKGIGPKIEEALNGMGFFHLDQIASWGPAQIAWMDEHLEDFRGRVTRDDWVGQARQLASGRETESSRRADEGDVHD